MSTPPAGAGASLPADAPAGGSSAQERALPKVFEGAATASATDSATDMVGGAAALPVAPLGARPSARPVAVVKDVADVVAQTILRVPGVAGLHGGPFGTVATYLPGRRVSGVAVRPDTPSASDALADVTSTDSTDSTVSDDGSKGSAAAQDVWLPIRGSVEVSVVAAAERGLETDLQALVSRIRSALFPLVSGPVSITIADLDEAAP